MKKAIYAMPFAALALMLSSAGIASAQSIYLAPSGTQYSVPASYTLYNNNGIYYDSAAGVYYDAATGQTSTTAPSGPAQLTAASYNIPLGYAPYNYGIYYDSATSMYYDPATGQTSATAPSGPASAPSGYSASSYGTYYNPATGLYFDPATGFYSNTAPSGPSYNTSTTYQAPSGTVYAVPSGYTASTYGTYYNSTTGTYYDPVTGFTSTSAPPGPAFATAASTGPVTTPGLPNTGAGGEAPLNLLILAASLALAGLGAASLRTRQAR